MLLRFRYRFRTLILNVRVIHVTALKFEIQSQQPSEGVCHLSEPYIRNFEAIQLRFHQELSGHVHHGNGKKET